MLCADPPIQTHSHSHPQACWCRGKRIPGRTPIPAPRPSLRLYCSKSAGVPSTGWPPFPTVGREPLQPPPQRGASLCAPAPPHRSPRPQPLLPGTPASQPSTPPSWAPSSLDPKSLLWEGPRGLDYQPLPSEDPGVPPSAPQHSLLPCPRCPLPGSPVCPLPSVFSSR